MYFKDEFTQVSRASFSASVIESSMNPVDVILFALYSNLIMDSAMMSEVMPHRGK